MKIEHILLNNIFSFNKNVCIPLLKDFNLIAGPNNTGKTNIIRILKTILDTLEKPTNIIENSYFFDINKQSEIKIFLILDNLEVDAIIGFLYFQCTCIKYVHPSKNKEKLRNYFKKMILELQWNVNDENSPPSVQIEIKFENFPLFFLIDNNRSISMRFNDMQVFFNEESLETISNVDVKELDNTLKNNKEDILNTVVDSSFSLNNILKINRDLMNIRDRVKETFNDLNFFYRGEKEKTYTLIRLIHQILKYGLYFSLRRNIEIESQYEEAFYVENDGRNLANFLFTLKNSTDQNLNKTFQNIQEKFKEIFSDILSFDTILKNKNGQMYISLVIDEGHQISKRFMLDKVGDGIIDSLLLITLFYGQRNKIIFLDEPATNLHNTLLETIINTILKDRNTGIIEENQIVIITHSEVLLSLLFYNKQLQIICCNKINYETKLSVLDLQDPDLKDIKLQHIFKPKALLGKINLVVEGPSDFEIINGLSYYYFEDPKKRHLSLIRNDIVITYAESKDNFPKFKTIFEKIGMKYYFIGDKDAENESRENVKEIFESPSYITESGIIYPNNKNDVNIFVIKNGNLENLLKEIDKNAYDLAEKKIKRYGRGNNKPLLAKLWLEIVYNNNRTKLNVLEDLLSLIISYPMN